MRVIGLTGGIASGKSTVARILGELGAVVIDADLLAREVVVPGEPALERIAAEFGSAVLHADGTLNREALGSIVFASPQARHRLEAITHPVIRKRAEEKLAALRAAGTPVAVYMAALLIEAKATDRVDEVWVVYVDEATQLARLVARDGCTLEEARRRIGSQLPMEEKRRHGRVVIDNKGTREELEKTVRSIWQREIVERGE